MSETHQYDKADRRSSMKIYFHGFRGLGRTPTSEKGILYVQMHCLPSCEYRIDGKLEFRKNKANKRRRGIKLYIELALKRLKRFSNIKPFSSVSFYFTTFNGI